MTKLQESLKKCKVEGNTVFLPPINVVLPNYNEVKTALIKAGAAYKKNAFVFPSEAKPFFDRLMGGEKVNIQKEFQYYEMPTSLVDRLIEFAQIESHDNILEPSAGQGAILEGIQRRFSGTGIDLTMDYCELMENNRNILGKKIDCGGLRALCVGIDFLKISDTPKWNKIIANPPFTKNADIDHIRKMYAVCKSGGRIVTIASLHWQMTENKKEIEFKKWLDKIGGRCASIIEAGAFKESGTNVATCIIVINKK